MILLICNVIPYFTFNLLNQSHSNIVVISKQTRWLTKVDYILDIFSLGGSSKTSTVHKIEWKWQFNENKSLFLHNRQKAAQSIF